MHVLAEDHTKPGQHMPDSVTVTITLGGNASPQAKRMLLRAASQCPVKRMLSGQLPGGVHEQLAGDAAD